MSKASDKILGELHGKLAEAMLNSLATSDNASDLLEKHFEEGLPEDVREFLESVARPNPALLTAITKFLKDNDISCVVADDEQVTKLEQKLKEKQTSRKRVGNVIPITE